MVGDCFFVRLAVSDHDEVVGDDLDLFQVADEFVHFSLKHLWRRADPEWHPFPTVAPKRRVEGREVGGFFVKLHMPKTVSDVQLREHLRTM